MFGRKLLTTPLYCILPRPLRRGRARGGVVCDQVRAGREVAAPIINGVSVPLLGGTLSTTIAKGGRRRGYMVWRSSVLRLQTSAGSQRVARGQPGRGRRPEGRKAELSDSVHAHGHHHTDPQSHTSHTSTVE
jgi:hypothetical protein